MQSYIAQYKATALQNEKEYGIPAPIILAQGILESGAGTSGLTRSSNNHFGIKAGAKWNGGIHRAWDDEKQKSRFRCYASAAESYRDHALLLTTKSCYRPLFKINIYDYRGWAHGLKKAGYATAPNYAQALIGIIDRYRLYEINGGVKLKPGKTVTIVSYKTIEHPVFEEECVMADDEESEEEVMIEEAQKRYAVLINDIHCTVLQPGETLGYISRRYDISPEQLLQFNERGSEYQIKEGDIVFLDKKKKKYEGPQDVYIAKDGDTLYEISQEFGIQLHQLARMNNMNDHIQLREGTRIVLK
ncbi:MAG: glucosaminidase domain-containing protein [Muribaculaceae bacterium]|nr:glucosaminidase domain-containing protein [Muribaculaceae bacterium]